MLLFLPYDMLIEMVRYLLPKEFKLLFISVNDDKCIQKELRKCLIVCTEIVSKNLIDWFESEQIELQLVKHYHEKINWWTGYKEQHWTTNGQSHSVNDKQAVITNETKTWYKYGVLHRDNDKPAIESLCGYRAWFINGQRVKQQLETGEMLYY
jgi:hypothetical protein